MLEYSRLSRALIAAPLTTTITTVVTTITLAALRTDTGSRKNRDNRRSTRFGLGTLGISAEERARRPLP